jgi:hypothetical protein
MVLFVKELLIRLELSFDDVTDYCDHHPYYCIANLNAYERMMLMIYEAILLDSAHSFSL